MEVEVGGVLGSGGFSNIMELRSLKGRSERSESVDSTLPAASHHSVASSEGAKSYAVKRLRNDLQSSRARSGAIDLAVEAQFLTALSHPNIVSLHCVGETPGNRDFFIIIERIDRTLAQEFKAWSGAERRIMDGKFKRIQKMQRMQLVFDSRLSAAIEITNAMKYLHKRNIIFRDLKPQNIGIDFQENIKIFDFGCAKELKEEQKVGQDRYLSTARTGTQRYMAPEVHDGTAYGLSADVYSFCILLWEMLTLTRPFKKVRTLTAHARAVYKKKQRPRIQHSWPKELKTLLQKGWHPKPSYRPSMDEVCNVLESLLTRNQ